MGRLIVFFLLIICGIAIFVFSEDFSSFAERKFLFPNEIKFRQSADCLARGNFKEFSELLNAFIRDDNFPDNLKSFCFYNLACLELFRAAEGNQKAALDAFFYTKETLRLNSFFWDAKVNLELMLRKGAEQKSGQRQQEQAKKEKGGEEEKDEARKKVDDPRQKNQLPSLIRIPSGDGI